MIKFFRQIRHSLLSENRLSKYLIYAVGEIVLVVLGILIALSINNWNEAEKERSKELVLLKTLELDLAENMLRLKQVISSDSLTRERNIRLIQILKEDHFPYHDSLLVYFANISTYNAFFPQVMAYESLKSEGVDLIKNDSLKFSIIKLFDDDYERNAHITEIKKNLAMDVVPFLNKHFETIDLDDGGIGKLPVDFESLKGKSELINTISSFSSAKRRHLSFTRNIFENTRSTRAFIANEIKRLENK